MIVLDRVYKSWDGERSFAVQDLSLTVGQGEVVALLGGSGCGKSTTVRMINRLTDATRGTILIDGVDVCDRDPVELRRGIGYVFQAVGLFPHLTVVENIGIIPRINGRPKSDSQIGELLDLVHLPIDEFGPRYPAQLSGGQRQRVGFARALASSPQVMLLDEPFGALDPVTRDDLQREFQRLQVKLKFTAVLVTHDMAEALLLAHRIAVMKAGRLVRLGTPTELLSDPRDDYVAALLETPRRHATLLKRLESSADSAPSSLEYE